MTTMTRQQEISKLWKDNRWLYGVVGFLIGLLTFPFLTMVFFKIDELLVGFLPEAGGIIFTVFILNRIYLAHEIDNLKKRLIREAGYQSNEIAKSAVDWMQAEEWLKGDGGLLKGANLQFANLQEARLRGANLRETKLRRANLEDADLIETRLDKSYLVYANLKGSKLNKAHLEDANLTEACLKDAMLAQANLSRSILELACLKGASLFNTHLENAKLSGANLSGADLRHSHLENVIWEREVGGQSHPATLPDGTKGRNGMDTSHFTDHKHAKFKATLEKINAIREEMGLNPIPLW